MVHVGIATSVRVALFAVLSGGPSTPSSLACSCSVPLMPGGRGPNQKSKRALREASRHGVVLTAFIVIFLAEWGDLTQIVTANLAAKYHSPLSVGVGSLLALGSVAAIAVVGGQGDRGVECPGSTRARRSRRRTTPPLNDLSGPETAPGSQGHRRGSRVPAREG